MPSHTDGVLQTWANTTGLIRNILFEDILLERADTLLDISAWYGKCAWCHQWVQPSSSCRLVDGFGYWGGACAQTENNIAIQNVTPTARGD